jgi:hypothetical protein
VADRLAQIAHVNYTYPQTHRRNWPVPGDCYHVLLWIFVIDVYLAVHAYNRGVSAGYSSSCLTFAGALVIHVLDTGYGASLGAYARRRQ